MNIPKAFPLAILTLSSITLSAQDRLNPSALPPPHGYSHVVVAPPGRLVVISGQVPLNAKGDLVGKDDFEAQCVQVHENIKTALASRGLTFKDVIRTDIFITDRSNLQTLRKVRAKYLSSGDPPASTLIVVNGLFRPDVLLEVSVEAIAP